MAKNKYYTHVEPRLKEIEKWVAEGATQEIVAKKLGISPRSLTSYLKDFADFAEVYKKGQIDLVGELRGALIKKSLGFSKFTQKAMKCKTIDYEDGKKQQEREEVAFYEEEIYFPPDVAALNLALKNYDKDNWSNDPQALELKKKELKLKEKQIENNSW